MGSGHSTSAETARKRNKTRAGNGTHVGRKLSNHIRGGDDVTSAASAHTVEGYDKLQGNAENSNDEKQVWVYI